MLKAVFDNVVFLCQSSSQVLEYGLHELQIYLVITTTTTSVCLQ